MAETPTTRKRLIPSIAKFQEGAPAEATEDGERLMDVMYGLVGKVSSQWSLLELSLDQTIWDICRLDPSLGACLTAQFTSTSARTRCILALISQTEDSAALVRKINQFDQTLITTTKKRNRVVHDALGLSLPENKPMNFRAIAEKRLELGLDEVSDVKYKAILDDVIKLREEYEALRAEILAHFHRGVSGG